MKVVLVGTFTRRPDEGLRMISNRVLKEMQQHHEVLALNTGEALAWKNLRKLLRFKPNLVHYLNGPTVRSLAILRIYKALLKNVVCIASATRPFFSRISRSAVGVLKPDLVLTQAERWELFFRSKGIRAVPVMNGVDLDRFRPVQGKREKEELRRRHGIPPDKFVVLHVGHIKRNRNVEVFSDLQKSTDVQCVIVGSPSGETDKLLKDQLVSPGCLVIDKFFENVTELYQASDCYVFCVKPVGLNEFPRSYNQVGVIDTPLSVLEAMACNLPVVTTGTGSLPRLFDERDGFFFYDGSPGDLLSRIEAVRRGCSAKTREMAAEYDWSKIIARLQDLYADAVSRI